MIVCLVHIVRTIILYLDSIVHDYNLLLFGGFHLKVNYKEAVKFIVDIARGQKSLDEIEEWIKENSVKVDDIELDLDKYVRQDLEQIKDYMKS